MNVLRCKLTVPGRLGCVGGTLHYKANHTCLQLKKPKQRVNVNEVTIDEDKRRPGGCFCVCCTAAGSLRLLHMREILGEAAT